MVMKDKKAIVFSLIAIALSSLFIIMFSTTTNQPFAAQSESARTRIIMLNNEVDEFYHYAQKAQEIAGWNAFEALYNEIGSTTPPTYLGPGNFDNRFILCLRDGTGCANAAYLSSLLTTYANEASDAGQFTLDYTIIYMDITSENYWSIGITTVINVSVADPTYASWRVIKTIKTNISTIGVHDPAYLQVIELYSGDGDRRIVPNEVERGSWNLSAFTDFFAGKEYHPSSKGGCLSERFEGTWETIKQGCGLESILDANNNTDLKNNPSIAHLDYQTLNAETYGCDDGGSIITNPRVGVGAVSYNLTLDLESALNYGLTDDDLLMSAGFYTARGCPGFSWP